MMLTFFVLEFLYINLQCYMENYVLNKKLKLKLILVTVLGFLTQYYFCLYAAFLCLINVIIMLVRKEKIAFPTNDLQADLKKDEGIANKKFKLIFTYIFQFIISAIIGIAIFPESIKHIFSSYRGIGNLDESLDFATNIVEYFKLLAYSFSISTAFLSILIVLIISCIIYNVIKKQSKKAEIGTILVFPVLLFFVCMIKIVPNLQY